MTSNLSNQITNEATAFAICYLEWFNNSAPWRRGADIYRREDGEYRCISSGCATSDYNVVIRDVSGDMFGYVDSTTTADELAEMLVDSGFMAEIYNGGI